MKLSEIIRAPFSLIFWPLRWLYSYPLYLNKIFPPKQSLTPNLTYTTPSRAATTNTKMTIVVTGIGDIDPTVHHTQGALEFYYPPALRHWFSCFSLYDYSEHICKNLIQKLNDTHNEQTQIKVISHSMGGLATLLAILNNKKLANDRLEFVILNSFPSYYALLTQNFPLACFILSSLPLTLGGTIMRAASQTTLIQTIGISILGTSLSIALITLTISFSCHVITYNDMQRFIDNPLKKVCYALLNPLKHERTLKTIGHIITYPIALVSSLSIACLLLLKEALLLIPRPFIYALLFIMNSHQNISKRLFKRLSSEQLLPPTTLPIIKIKQAKDDSLIPSYLRLSNLPLARHLETNEYNGDHGLQRDLNSI
ncbi:hypothetical protein MMH89_01100 [Candidatus Comchoanobacter bicostacola]|uniref:Uncharacterized protein n=1 Tax=Candidatus Comchoanobacter bicostacola TaxID=2919598 RepID=A0ABY5DLE9_9GAMM|nr:hypothetical protein [Candidatus Comchoanobacter bicostacola]UTC24752.1 hypothetical protein MMH89_01100 [Candidatus Comchoanobacter bicostacola]